MSLQTIGNISHFMNNVLEASESPHSQIQVDSQIATLIDHVDYAAKEVPREKPAAALSTMSATINTTFNNFASKLTPVGFCKTKKMVGMSPYKTEAAILPKPLNIINTPVHLIGTPQRVISFAGSPTASQTIHTLDQANWLGKRLRDTSEAEYPDSAKKLKKSDKGGKGLRHFSMKVCEKVQKKGVTTYNEVADELVAEFSDPQRSMSPSDQAYDQKNIRRRVYDALNVLMAMNIISKEKKEIRWLGLPTNSAQECTNLELEKQKRLDRIKLKSQQVQELVLQQIAFKNLVQRNQTNESSHGHPNPHTAIQLPFIIVNTCKETVIDCSISSDKTEYQFKFDKTFEIHDDIEVLKRMGLTFALEKGECTEENLEKARKLIPRALETYVQQIASGNIVCSANSIIAGPSGFKSIGDVPGSECSDSCDVSSHDGADLTDSESNGILLSRQSSVTSLSDSGYKRVDPENGTDDDYLESGSEDADELMEN